MKCIFTILSIALLIVSSGCYSAGSLNRRPRKKVSHRRTATPPEKNKNPDDGRDPLFDTIFHRNRQTPGAGSIISERERELLRQNDVRNDPAVRSMHGRDRKSGQGNADWVFGTKDGSYFK